LKGQLALSTALILLAAHPLPNMNCHATGKDGFLRTVWHVAHLICGSSTYSAVGTDQLLMRQYSTMPVNQTFGFQPADTILLMLDSLHVHHC
jgi:hypothetical protein